MVGRSIEYLGVWNTYEFLMKEIRQHRTDLLEDGPKTIQHWHNVNEWYLKVSRDLGQNLIDENAEISKEYHKS